MTCAPSLRVEESFASRPICSEANLARQVLMLYPKVIAVWILVLAVLLGSALRIDFLTKVDAAPSLFEVIASPTDDPDPRDETSIAISPINDQVIVGASKVIQGGGTLGRGDTLVAYYFSSDGGRSWGTGLIGLETPQKSWGRASDPSVAADLDGNFYLCVLMLDNGSLDRGIYVFKSTDNGRSFTEPVVVAASIGLSTPILADKCYITIDVSSSSPFKNTIYVVWVSTEPDRTVILTSHRRPGEAAYSAPKTISHKGDMRGPSLATGPNGEFYAAWLGIGTPRVILFNASTDGGVTFLPPEAAPSSDFVIHDFTGSLSAPDAALVIDGMERMNSFPVLDVDRSSGPNRGMIYVAWAETTNRIDADIFVERLTPPNGGRPIISSPMRVNNDVGAADQFFPWLSVDSTTGAVEVAFYDRRDAQGTVFTNVYLARSTDAGQSFGENIRISSAPSDTRIQADVVGSNNSTIGIGDYIGTIAEHGKAHILWTDTRRNKQEVRYGQVDFGSSAPPPPIGFPNDNCQSPRVIAALPYLDALDTSSATSSPDDPLSCTGGQDTNSVWYALTPSVNTAVGVDTTLSDYDTVVSVYTGSCGSPVRMACSDDFGNPPGNANRSVLTFSASAGVTYMIEASGKGSGGALKMRAGYPTITGVEYTTAPDGSNVLRITGAGFRADNVAVTAQLNGEDVALPNISFAPPLPDGKDLTLFATKKKLKKLVKRGSLLIRVESPVGSGNISNSFLFTH